MSSFRVMEAVNLFCGDEEEGKFLTLDTLKLPDLEEEFADHAPGGGAAMVEIGMGVIRKLEPTFKLNGFDPDMLAYFGLGSGKRPTFTAYGVVRDKGTGEAHEGKAVIQARLGKIAPDEFKRGDLMGHDYALREVWRYALTLDGRRLFDWSFRANRLIVGEVDQLRDTNRILRIS